MAPQQIHKSVFRTGLVGNSTCGSGSEEKSIVRAVLSWGHPQCPQCPPGALTGSVLSRAMQGHPGSTLPPRDPC